MRIVISGIPIDVQKKNIKNMHLQVKPPDGHVVISAPLSVDDKAIEAYARTQLGFIKRSIAQFRGQSRASKRQYVSGETMYIWGKQYFLVFKPNNQKNSLEIQNQNIILSMSAKSTVKQRDAYVKEEYRKILKEEIEKRLPKWEVQTGLKCNSWQTKYMVTKWGACSTDKKKLWFNLQLAQKQYACLDYIILHELTHLLTRKHDAIFIAHMDRYMPNWREVRKELNDSRLDYYEAQDESPLQKLIDQKRYDEIKDVVLDYMSAEVKEKKAILSDIEIQNVVHIEQVDDGAISFSVIVSCDIEHSISTMGRVSFTEKWLDVRCKVLLGVELTDFEIININECEQQEDSDNDKYSGELVPIISRDAFENEATKFLEKYYPLALQEPVAVPIRKIAENMGLSIIEDSLLSSELDIFGLVVFEDGNIKDKNKNIVIRNAKRGTVLIDPRVYYERTLGTVNFTVAHECFHWYRHQPYHALMKMLGANDKLGKIIQCSIGSNAKDSEKWKAMDWMEWQANGVAPHILMPTNTAKIKISELIEKYHIHFDGTDDYQIEEMISELADFYGLSKQAVKMRIREMGFAKVDGAFTYVNGQYVTPFSFDASALTDNQSFTISSADLFKAYCLNKDFRKAIDTGKFVYVEGHVCLDDEKYIIHSEGRVKLTQHALSHMDECCLVFDKGYSYQSKYQGQKYYVQMMYKTLSQVAAQEYSFEMNAHNRTLLSQIQRASRSADAMRLYPGAFSETLVQLMKEKKLSNKKLADASLVGERTIQRLRNEEEYPTTVQTVLGLCYGLQLSVPEAEMLVGKTDFNIKPTNPQNNAYRCVLSSCAENSIYEVNEMLESCGFEPLGSSKMG